MRESHTGKRFTDEHKKKLSEANKGRCFTEEHRKKLSETHRGNVAWNKGMHFGKRAA
jgi:hypothetical protein